MWGPSERVAPIILCAYADSASIRCGDTREMPRWHGADAA
jgi:hypothetical protein